ncbi:MAG: DUF4271 domain-containing protein [Flavobacteriaceae bacterium]|nr:DUF4271 domain-containing protein [Flavobacteriaceae bacterium]
MHIKLVRFITLAFIGLFLLPPFLAAQSDSLLYDNTIPTSKSLLLDELSLDSQARVAAMPYTLLSIQKPMVDREEFDPLLPPMYAIKKIPTANNLLIFFIVLNIVAVIAGVKAYNEHGVYSFISTMFTTGNAIKYLGDHKTVFHSTTMQLMSVSSVMIALTAFLTPGVELFGVISQPALRFMALLGLIFFVYLAKASIHYLLGQLFEVEKMGMVIVHHTIGINFLFILVFFPFFLINYLNNNTISDDQMKGILIALLLVSLIYRLLREASVLLYTFPYPKFYLALYLCTVEILPWLIGIKLIAS